MAGHFGGQIGGGTVGQKGQQGIFNEMGGFIKLKNNDFGRFQVGNRRDRDNHAGVHNNRQMVA